MNVIEENLMVEALSGFNRRGRRVRTRLIRSLTADAAKGELARLFCDARKKARRNLI